MQRARARVSSLQQYLPPAATAAAGAKNGTEATAAAAGVDRRGLPPRVCRDLHRARRRIPPRQRLLQQVTTIYGPTAVLSKCTPMSKGFFACVAPMVVSTMPFIYNLFSGLHAITMRMVESGTVPSLKWRMVQQK